MGNPSFAFKNYNRSTPQLYLRIAKLVKRILYGLSLGSVLIKSEEWISIITIVMIPTVEELVQFISDESQEANTIKVEANPETTDIILDKPKP